MRLHEPTSGTIRFDGQDITRLSARQLRPLRRDLVMVFQDPQASLNPRKRVDEIVGMPLRIHGIASGAALRSRVGELLELVGLSPSHAQRYPHEFSGGQRQRIGLARALATNPRMVVCDEPVSALDVSIQAQILNLLGDLQRELRLTLVFIAHDLGVVRHVSDRVAVMYLGRIVELAPVDELYARPVHPYSEALLSAVPVPDPDVARQRDRARGRRAEPDRPAPGLPVPPALPLRDRAVPRRRSRPDDRRRQTASDRLPPSARSTHRACCAVVSSERAIIEVEGLRKAYGETIALAGVDLEVPAGTVLGLLGPNGAGKTTIVRVLATLLIPDGGHARIDGIDVVERPQEARRLLGLAGQYAAVDETLTGRENLEMIGQLYGLRRKDAKIRAAEALARLTPDRRVRAPRAHVLGRHAAASRPRGEPRRAPQGAADGRADDRPRPAYAHRPVGSHRRSSWPTARRCC